MIWPTLLLVLTAAPAPQTAFPTALPPYRPTALPPYRPPADTSYWQQGILYTIVAGLDEPTGVLTGAARLVYRNNSPQVLNEIYFHLYLNAFRPGSLWSGDERREGIARFADLPDPWHAYERLGPVTIDGAPVTATYPGAPDSTIARFELPRPLPPGDSLVVLLQWTARPSAIPRRQGRLGRRFDFAQGYPKVCVYDKNGWQAHPLRLAGELYGEFGTYDVTLDLAEDQVVAATGVPIEGDPGWARVNVGGGPVTLQRDWYGSVPRTTHYAPRTGRKAVRFYAENIHHFAWSTNPEYRYEEGRYNDIVLRTLYLPGDSATWGGGRVIERTVRAMAWLDTIFGPYPYPQTVVLHRIEGGGTEFPMLVMNGGPEESLIFHEVGHIYTYGILGNNEWKEGWLDEGFTTFQTAWNFQGRGMSVPSTATQQLILNMDLDEWSRPVATVAEDFPEFGIYNRMIYTKGQLFHEILRYVVGEETFRRGLRLYYDRWKLKHVDEDAYRLAMEEVSGQDLRYLFREWLHESPRVDYALGGTQTWRLEDGQWRTEITVTRKGTGVMPVDIAVPVGDTVYIARVSGLRRRESVQITTPDRPGRIELDPSRRTMDWNYLNNREAWGILSILGPVAPRAVHRIGWSGSSPSRRDRRVHNWMPLAWANDAGGVQAGLQWRSNYLGRFDQNALQLTVSERGGRLVDRVHVWATLRNPHWMGGPRARWGVDLFKVEGRSGLLVNITRDVSRHMTFGPRRTLGLGFSLIDVSDSAYADRSRWTDKVVTELSGFAAVRWARPGRSSDLRIGAGAGFAGVTNYRGLQDLAIYGRLSADLRHARSVGMFELRLRGYLAGALFPDSMGIPLQRAFSAGGPDPYETLQNPFLRSRGALLTRTGVNYAAPGGGGLRAYAAFPVGMVAAANAELMLPVFRAPRRRAFTGLSIGAFADAALQGGRTSFTAAAVPGSLADAGVGVRATHRIGPTTFTTRFDFPLYVSRPALALGADPGDGKTRFRFVWSLEEAF